ncbi:MAG: phosphatase PAP2 family protein [Actinomycetota bacterium]|nr:phosphatase PAP2 family protein [Actinomycetota bacterium]
MSAEASTGILVVRPVNWSRIRSWLAAAYGVVLGIFILNVGLPTERLALFCWVLIGLSIGCVGRGWRAVAGLLLDWLPFVGILVLYDLTRGLADSLGMPVHVNDLAALESAMFGGTLPTVWLQDQLGPSGGWVAGEGAAWWHVLVTAVYVSHFFVTPIIAAVLWLRDRRRWIGFTARFIGVALLGVATYVLVPAAPPWYAANRGVIPEVDRLSGLGWEVIGLDRAGALLDQGQAKVNLVAAIPSLHTAYAVLVLLFFWPVLARTLRVILACYPLLMGLILVYSGEHYVVDVLLGWACAAIVAIGVTMAERAWRSRRDRALPPKPREPREEEPTLAGAV